MDLEIAEIRRPLGQGISGDVALHRRLANVADPANDPRWSSGVDEETGYRTQSILAAPLVASRDGELLGVLQLLNKHDGAFTAFDEELILAFSQHAAAALDRARLVDEIRVRSAIEVSLGVAREIQLGFMPEKLPTVTGYELASWWFPHQAVGGDYCDVIERDDGKLALVIADVSGHGLGPALLMASVRAAFRALMLEHSDPEVLMRLLGKSLAVDLQDGRFITLALVELDPQRHLLEYANAGHAPALCYSAHHNTFTSLEATGMPLGVLDEPEYDRGRPVALDRGDLIVLCTDGIVEAMNDESQQFGQSRLEEIVRENASRQLLKSYDASAKASNSTTSAKARRTI